MPFTCNPGYNDAPSFRLRGRTGSPQGFEGERRSHQSMNLRGAVDTAEFCRLLIEAGPASTRTPLDLPYGPAQGLLDDGDYAKYYDIF